MVRDTVTTPCVVKVKTGAIWYSPRAGLWQKLSLGNKCHKTKPVGYTTEQFDPSSERNVRRFIPCEFNPAWLCE